MEDNNNLEGDAKPTFNPTKRNEFNVGIKAKREVRRTDQIRNKNTRIMGAKR